LGLEESPIFPSTACSDFTRAGCEGNDPPLERFAVGVPSSAKVVHATSMAGPFSGGSSKAVHSVAIFDLLLA
jgi:hypothetical protein